ISPGQARRGPRPLRAEEMEAAARRRPQPEEQSAADGERPPALSGQSYWLDLWLFVLFDVALFIFIYLLP
uniref:HCV F-transactivated protein 1 n=1 Tax=Pavo cristatus TaxID=9049 RepID=A0A8C9G4T5_PAVCR